MISFFPDLNVWLALSVASHRHNAEAWRWLNLYGLDARLIMCRHTQMGMLRLLTNPAAMGDQILTLREAWAVYDWWLEDPRVEFYPEPRGLDQEFRDSTRPFAAQHASKWIGDCYLLAYAKQAGAALVTFDRGLYDLAEKQDCSAVMPS